MTTGRALARRLVLHPTLGWPVRLVRPGWPDAGRLVAQGPALRPLLAAAAGGAPPRPTVVNAGAGEGLYTPLIHRLLSPSQVIEFDLQTPPVRALDGTCQRRLRGSLTAIPIASHSADVVVCTEVLEHVPDDVCAVSEMARVLKPGGFLVLSVLHRQPYSIPHTFVRGTREISSTRCSKPRPSRYSTSGCPCSRYSSLSCARGARAGCRSR